MKKSFEKIKKFKLPITIENILIKKPIYTLKKNPDERKKNKFPGKEKELYIIKKTLNKKADNKKFDENKSLMLKSFNSTKLEISLPIKAAKNIIGIKPINVVIINFVLEIFNIERHMFWTIKGNKEINLNKIKYS